MSEIDRMPEYMSDGNTARENVRAYMRYRMPDGMSDEYQNIFQIECQNIGCQRERDRLSEFMSVRLPEYITYLSKSVLTCHGGDHTK